MAGHSKWANIRHRKASVDAKRGAQFTKIAKELTVAAKEGGGDEVSNPRLRSAIVKARSANMPKDNIEKAIKKGTGELEGVTYEEFTYEAYGPNGIAIIIETLTDKKSRTIPDVKAILTKAGGSMAENGSVSFLFDHMGVIIVKAPEITEDEFLDIIVESGADDYELDEENIYVIKTQKEQFHNVFSNISKVAEEKTWEILEQGLKYIPKSQIELEKDPYEKLLSLFDNLEDYDDVQNIYSNLEMSAGGDE